MSGTACDCEGITAGLARELTARDGRTVAEDNLGRSGDTAADLLDQLDQDDVRATLKRADYVVVVTGANDLATLLDDEDDVESCDSDCSQPVIAAMQSRLAQALQTINHLTSGHATILVDGYWNVFQDGDQATSQYGIERVLWSRDLTRQANAAIAAAAQHAGARYVDLAAAFTAAVGDDPTSLLADDGDHPNAAGVQLIVRANLAVVDHTAPDHSDRRGAR